VSNATPREVLIPQQKMQMLHQLDAGRVPWTLDYVSPLYGCTGCGACRQVCGLDNEVAGALWDGRATARARRAVPPVLEGFAERFRRRGEMLRKRTREIVPRERIASEARVGFHPACDAVETSPSSVLAALEVFDRVGADYVRVVEPGEACLGMPLLAAGETAAFRRHARKVVEQSRGYAKIISTCAGCVFAARAIYPMEGLELPPVVHFAEWIGDFAERLPQPKARPKAFYHDPCYLGRQLGVFEPPRRALARRAEVVEFSRNRESSECSGGGGLVPITMPDTALAAARRRLVEPREAGATRVVTACATCKRSLEKAGGGLEVLDLAEALIK
jgi:heterodisulfide reductase subunit D